MQIINLTEDSKLYTSNVFLILGTWNAVSDVNTLIDVGCDAVIIERLSQINTGLGKNKVDQVLITHSHSDHSALLPDIIKAYKPKVYAFSQYLPGVDKILHDGDMLKIGDSICEVFHITAHSADSVCFYCEKEKILFAGDTKFPINFENYTLSEENKNVISRLRRKTIHKVYYGHGSFHDFTNKTFVVN